MIIECSEIDANEVREYTYISAISFHSVSVLKTITWLIGYRPVQPNLVICFGETLIQRMFNVNENVCRLLGNNILILTQHTFNSM